MNLRNLKNGLRLSVACAALVWGGALMAQEKPASRTQQEPSPKEQLIDVEVTGGTLGDLVDYLKKHTKVSYVITREAREYPVPDIAARQVTAIDVLNGVMYATQGEVWVNASPVTSSQVDSTVIQINVSQAGLQRIQPTREVRVYVFQEFKDKPAGEFKAQADKVVRALEAGEAAAGLSAGDRELRAFSEAGLLFARGTQPHLNLIDQIVMALGGTRLPGETPKVGVPVSAGLPARRSN